MSDSEPAGQEVKLVACVMCQAPVVASVGQCPACGTPVTGREPAYRVHTPARPQLAPLFKWWLIWSALVWVLSGFSLGQFSSFVITVIAVVYLVRIVRAYVAE